MLKIRSFCLTLTPQFYVSKKLKIINQKISKYALVINWLRSSKTSAIFPIKPEQKISKKFSLIKIPIMFRTSSKYREPKREKHLLKSDKP